MTKTKKLNMELPKEGRFISSEFPILRENLRKIDQAIADVEEKIDEKAPSKHTHSINDVADLEATLKGKMAADKTFSFADLSDIEGAQDAANNYVLYKSSNNNFTFGSAISLLGMHQHKTEDIVGLDDFRAKINEDLTAYGRLAQANEWQNDNKFNNKVTMSGDVELTGNSSLSLTHNGEVVTSLSTTESKLKGPLKVDGEAVYTKSEIDKLMALFTKKPVEILMTESGDIPLPEGVTDDTEIEIWAWGGGGGGGGGCGGYSGGGGGGGQCARVKIKGSDLKKSAKALIGRGGRGGEEKTNGSGGGATVIKEIVQAGGGGGGGGETLRAAGKKGGGGDAGYLKTAGLGDGGRGGEGGILDSDKTLSVSSVFSGGEGGVCKSNGGNSVFGGGGGGGGSNLYSKEDIHYETLGGESYKGGDGGGGGGGGGTGNNRAGGGGGGGGYFRGKDGDRYKKGSKAGGDGGDGAILLKFFI
ncbi:Bgr_08870 family protein [Bartonella sp. AR 15-3]|uniref:Bgr_08870 family protein n=1 Tax=Bartonella sp. AR 15-3 TaxID=545617 RepID=UPI0001F4C68B|nr:Bgr_08870 family protein [Bartonella sp. AR 15-3]OPB31382.1 Phage tail repeat like [Bartonella sp. AR 15-3]CBI79580.1 conserved hypothetical protein [Bartonella sp. AR 15-3]